MQPDVTIDWEICEDIEIDTPTLKRFLEKLKGNEPDVNVFNGDSPWLAKRVLYAYVDPEDSEIVYVGKAWSNDTWSRFVAEDKHKLWDLLEDEYDLPRSELAVIVGTPAFTSKSRLTKETLAHLESLLIWHLEPIGNKQSTRGFRRREGKSIRCSGDWPLKQMTYVDE